MQHNRQGHAPARDQRYGEYKQYTKNDQYNQYDQYDQYSQYDHDHRRATDPRDRENGPDEYYRSRHGYSTSPPPRNTLSYDDLPEEEEPRHGHTRSYHGYHDDHAGREYGRPSDLPRDGSRQRRGYDRRDERDGSYDARGRRERSRGYYDDPHYRRRSESYSDHEHRRGRRSRSYSRSPSRHPGNPTDTVILEGLPGDVPINELQSTLMNSPALVDEGFIDIRIPATSGQRRAFVQFHSTDEAIAFLDKHFPKILMDGLTPHGEPSGGKVPLFVHFARSSREQRDDGDRRNQPADNWVCPSCDFSNYPTRPRCKMCGYTHSSTGTSGLHTLTGETDASNDPSQFLVIYPLDACVTEEVLEFGVKKLELIEKQQPQPPKDNSSGSRPLKSTAPTGDAAGFGARRGSLHRVFLVRDKVGGQSLKYGFAEFWTLEDATAALHKYRMHKAFTIGGAPVLVSSIHMGVFVPELQQQQQAGPAGMEDKYSFVPLFNPALRVQYRDPRVYASQRIVNAEMPGKPQAATGDPAREGGVSGTESAKKTKKRKAEGGLDASAAKKPVAMAGQMAMWQKKHQELHKDGAAAGSHGNGNGNGATSDSRPSTRNGTSGTDKAGPIKISLGGMAKTIATAENTNAQGSGDSDAQPVVSYVDRERVCCLICMMKYKSLDDLGIHERSGNHKRAMADEAKVKAAMPRLAARDKRIREKEAAEAATGADAGGEEGTEEEKAQYRDRAKERREVYSQPKKPVPQSSSSKGGKPKPKLDTVDKRAEEKAPAPAQSKGSAMLAKMGWTGQGLGAKGEGRTEVVAVEAYQEGVGLGVEGAKLGDAGKLAEMRTKGDYAEYLVSAQEKARERYSRLS